MTSGDERVELLRTHEPHRAEMARELLENEGIPVATPGLEHRSMLGVVGSYVEIVLQVPRRDLARARALLETLDAPAEDEDEAIDHDVAGAPHAPPRPTSTLGGKRRRVAIIASCVLPGGGHVYVSQWRAAALVAVLEIGALVVAGLGVPFAILLLPMALLADALGATWHCERLAGVASERSLRRFAPEIVLAIGAAWIGLMYSDAGASWLAGPRSTLVCEVSEQCWDQPRRECLWDAAARRIEPAILPGCETCLTRAEDCDEVRECGACWDE